MKKVSIIIPCFNQEEYIKEAIESALNQTYKNIEIICVNDGSDDNSAEIIKSLADKYKNILFFNLKENKGVIYARNFAIEASCGEYILPLDADDTIETTYVEKAVEILNDNPNIGIVYCKARRFGTENKIWNLPKYNLSDFLYENCIFNCALFRKNDFYKAGKYKENMKDGCEDWDLWMSIIELGLNPYRIDEILFNYRQHKNNSRNHQASKNLFWRNSLLKNHFELYLNDEKFNKKIFLNYEKKIKKYKKLNNALFSLALVFFIFSIGIVLWKTILN